DFNVFTQTLILHRFGGGGNTDGCGGHDQLQVGVLVYQGQGLIVTFFGFVITVDGVNQLQAGVGAVVGQHFFHGSDPGVLVGGIGAGGEDGKLATIVAHDAEGHVGHHFAGFVEVYLGHKHLLAFGGGDGGVPGNDGQASVEGGLGGGGNLVPG